MNLAACLVYNVVICDKNASNEKIKIRAKIN